MITVERYETDKREEWDKFCEKSKAPLFMFQRNYMDYHSDRFQDYSLMFFRDGELLALLPMNEAKNCLFSHGGLTYGGFITDAKMKQHTMNECFDSLISYAGEKGFDAIQYKLIPHIYHESPAEEDRYALFCSGAHLLKVEASTVVNLKNPLKMPKGRKAQISRARREDVVVKEMLEDKDFLEFIHLENDVLQARHGTSAVHTGEELALLHHRFPEHIHLFGAKKDGCLVAGTVIYEYGQTIHTQYMAANETAREIGALDFTIFTVMETYRDSKLWLDFGISTEQSGRYLNEGLISQKEGFGGRTNTYETWEINLKNNCSRKDAERD